MVFELTDSLADEILYCMENQNHIWLVDAAKSIVIDSDQDIDSLNQKEEQFYCIPKWTSDDGFELLRSFTNSLHSPLAREDLKQVLSSGRGVFRRFKDVIKAYPEVERLFFIQKDKTMKNRLMEWYNALRESWGLEKLSISDFEDTDDTEELVQDDFVFHEYDPSKDRDDIENGCGFVAEEYRRKFSFEVGDAMAFLWKKLSTYADSENKFGFVCRTQSDEFSGCFLVSFCPSSAKTTVTLTDFFVLQNFRGLGIGKELISKSLSHLKKRGIQWVIISNTIVPQSMEPLLARYGFDRLGSGYLADLAEVSF